MADESGSGFGGGGFGDYESLEQGSFAAPAYSPFDPVSTNPMTPLAAFNAWKQTLGPWDRAKLAKDLATKTGSGTMLDVLGIDRALGFLEKGLSTVFGPPIGIAMGRTARAGMAGTGSNADWGGGFSGPAGSTPGLDSGLGVPGTEFGGSTPNPLAQMPNPQTVASSFGGAQLDETMRELRAELDRLLAEYRMQDVFGGQG